MCRRLCLSERFVCENTYICLLHCGCVCVCVSATHVLGYCVSGCMIDGSAQPQSPQPELPDSMSLPVSANCVCVHVCLNMMMSTILRVCLASSDPLLQQDRWVRMPWQCV